ncbi:unnamed protein product [Lampetra planeri]
MLGVTLGDGLDVHMDQGAKHKSETSTRGDVDFYFADEVRPAARERGFSSGSSVDGRRDAVPAILSRSSARGRPRSDAADVPDLPGMLLRRKKGGEGGGGGVSKFGDLPSHDSSRAPGRRPT